MLLFFGLALACALIAFKYLSSRKQNTSTQTTKIEPQMGTTPPSPTPASLADLGYDVTLDLPPTAKPLQKNLTVGAPEDLLMIYLMAPTDCPFLGYELIQALLAANLRHGTLNLFHRFDEAGNILFSVAQTTQNGGFDLDKMGGITCRGLILFMPKTAAAYLDQLSETAYQLAEDLGGQLEDRHHQAIITTDYFETLKKETLI